MEVSDVTGGRWPRSYRGRRTVADLDHVGAGGGHEHAAVRLSSSAGPRLPDLRVLLTGMPAFIQ
jgi:hypothetical protein